MTEYIIKSLIMFMPYILWGIVIGRLYAGLKNRLDKIEDDIYTTQEPPKGWYKEYNGWYLSCTDTREVKILKIEKIEKEINRIKDVYNNEIKPKIKDKFKELEKKITEPKYNELMEYLDKHKMEVEEGLYEDMLYRHKKPLDWMGINVLTSLIYTIKDLDLNCSEIYFKEKQINLHPDQIQSLYNKAKKYYEAKELMGIKKEKKVIKTKKSKKK